MKNGQTKAFLRSGVKKNSRTTNTFYNFTTSVGGQLLGIIMKFVVQTVFIHTLGREYLGINSLFSNILQMLSLAELGVGNAILFKLYDPIAHDDKKRITVLINFYKTIYRFIGLVVLVIGCCLIPFLRFLIKDYDRLAELNINAAIIFFLYLMQSVSSYLFFAYKSAIVKANQKEYLLNLARYLFTIVSSILQIVCLFIFRNFIVYVAILIISVIGENFTYACIADKLFPYINEKCSEKLRKNEIIEIFKDCGALLLYKLNEMVVKSTDNIVLSAFLGLEMVALYSNYYIFYTTIKALYEKVYGAVAHAIGNLHTTHNEEHEYLIFNVVFLIASIIGGTAFIGIFVVGDEFIRTWIGKSWVLSQPFSFLMGLEIYTMSIRQALGKYRNAMGLFQQAKYRPLAGMIINIIVSVSLVNVWGITGVITGTLVADWTTFMWFDPIILHKYGFGGKHSVLQYYIKIIKNLLLILVIAGTDYMICQNFFVGHGWLSVILHAIICGISVFPVLLLCSWNLPEGKYLRETIGNYLRIIKKGLHK